MIFGHEQIIAIAVKSLSNHRFGGQHGIGGDAGSVQISDRFDEGFQCPYFGGSLVRARRFGSRLSGCRCGGQWPMIVMPVRPDNLHLLSCGIGCMPERFAINGDTLEADRGMRVLKLSGEVHHLIEFRRMNGPHDHFDPIRQRGDPLMDVLKSTAPHSSAAAANARMVAN